MLSLSKGVFIAGISSFTLCFAGTWIFSKKVFQKRVLKTALIWIVFTSIFQAGFSYYSTIPSTANFISGAKDTKRETTSFRIFTWKVSKEMISENPFLGVGANNFGIVFNESRKQFAQAFPKDPGHNVAEDHLVERAHNEFIQIFAELGIIGGGIFVLLFGFFAVWILESLIRQRRRVSPLIFGSLAGVIAFFISSLFSSFSFRLMQNGIVFLMVLSILVYELIKLNKKYNGEKHVQNKFSIKITTPVLGTAGLVILATGIFSSVTAISNYYVYLGENEANLEQALENFDTALVLNAENASAYFSKGMRLYAAKRMDQSSDNLKKAIDLGLGTVISYSYLSETFEKAGQMDKAEKALRESLDIFPHSIFTRVRYSIILENQGFSEPARKQLNMAKSFDRKHAKGWSNLIRYRSKNAYRLFQKNKDSIQPSALRPRQANLQYLDKINLPKVSKK